MRRETSCRIALHVLAVSAAAFSICCTWHPPPSIREAQVLGGEEIDAATLNRGREAYTYYCRACHGDAGDGRGPAGQGLLTPPRDFRMATFKFTGTPDGYLPHDEDLFRVVKAGLHGTAMLTWELPDPMVRDVIAYVKTFSPPGQGFRDPDAERTGRIEPGDDPWAGRRNEAVDRGRTVYHGSASCLSCHPSHESLERVNQDRAELGMPPQTALRANAWLGEVKESQVYLLPVPGDPPCTTQGDCEGATQVCNLGRCEEQARILPPDFTVNELRIGRSPAELYRIIASGVPGTAMPTWEGSLPREDIWALAHYVDWLRSLQGTHEGVELRGSTRAALGGGTGRS